MQALQTQRDMPTAIQYSFDHLFSVRCQLENLWPERKLAGRKIFRQAMLGDCAARATKYHHHRHVNYSC